MLPINLEYRHWINILFIFTLVATLGYFLYTPQNEVVISQKDSAITVDVVEKKKEFTVCDKVDIPWLAGDRIYWNGWEDKAMFMKQDGTFTKGNVYIKEGEQVCIVVLLGPTPAYSPQFETNHLGTKDSISMFANGQYTKQTIQLSQHKTQSNAYFAPVRFYHKDTIQLQVIDEYRSYFWEKPILHTYQPYHFTSQNNLTVTNNLNSQTSPSSLPICQLNDTKADLFGTWVDSSNIRQASLYNMYGNSDKDVTENGKIFVPNSCQLQHTTEGQGLRCLNKKTVHIWGDNNLRRNLKAFTFNGVQWCNKDEPCECNDDDEDTSLYPWLESPYTPMTLDNGLGTGAKIYYNNVQQSLDRLQLEQQMSDFIKDETLVKKADYVILGLGNGDIQALQVSPEQFKLRFIDMLGQVRQLYPTQHIIVRTPQYFCCGVIPKTSWNAGRSYTFASIVRDIVQQDPRLLLWDVHLLGTEDSFCPKTAYSKRNVINLENQLLWNLICSNSP